MRNSTKPKRHRLIALGGTFDHFHHGHESFILFAAGLSSKLLIGITSDNFPHAKKMAHTLQPFKVRQRVVGNFCKKNNIDCLLPVLNDPFGPPISHDFPEIDALCVTQETIANGRKINELRRASGLKELPIYVAPMVPNELGSELHAQHIRSGEVNTKGQVYLSHFKKDIVIDKIQRSFFAQPLGPIVIKPAQSVIKGLPIAVVGDFALNEFITHAWEYNLGVYDQKSKREPYTNPNITSIQPDLTLNNPAGMITKELLNGCANLDFEIKSKQHLLITGEEDLVTVALVLTLPLGSTIYYGQPNKGMVMLHLDERLKEKVFRVLTKSH